MRLETKALHDENKSLITPLRLLNVEIEKENKHFNLHMDETLEDPVQQGVEVNNSQHDCDTSAAFKKITSKQKHLNK